VKVSSRIVLVIAGAGLVAFAAIHLFAADDADVAKRLAALEAQQKQMVQELQQIKALLQNRPVPQPAGQPSGTVTPNAAAVAALTQPPSEPISLEGAAFLGSATAKLTLIEFSDFQCPFCARYVRDTYAQVQHDYVDTGKVRYAFRNFPLERIHPLAFKAAEAGECARQQGKFWEMHDRLFANQAALQPADLARAARDLGLNGAAFDRCFDGTTSTKVRQDLNDGARAGMTGTPTFYIGVVQKDGRVKALKKLIGAQPYAAFKTAIDSLLASPELLR